MYKKYKRFIFTMVLIIAILSGCVGKTTPKTIFVEMSGNLTKVTSFANDISVDVKLEDVIHVTEVCMDMTMESTLEPKTGHAKGMASIKLFGTKLESPIEIYQVIEDGENVIYSGLDDLWQRSVQSDQQVSGISFDSGMFQSLKELVDQFHLAEEAVRVNEKECYEIYGEMKGSALISLVGEELMNAYGIVDIPEQEAISELLIPVTIDVYKEQMLPARIHVDMTDEMNDFYDEIGESMNVNDFSIDIRFSDYNKVETITVPDEIKESHT